MKVILFCIAGIVAGAPFAPGQAIEASQGNHLAGNNLVDHNTRTATWGDKHVSTKGVGNDGSNTDHATHSDAIVSSSVPQHGADSRTAATVKTALTLHTRHSTLETGSSGTKCSSIQCDHVERIYNDVTTSSIVVKHVCQNHTTASGDAITDSWGAQFSSANNKASCDELECTTGHICGMTTHGDTLDTPVCECHAWDGLTGTHNYATAGNVNASMPALMPTAAQTGNNPAGFTDEINSGVSSIKVDNVTLPSSSNWP